uniref:insulin-like growth factor-binding protein complex acid labile subunit n=1 Tax=Styela clava TaxID=7725 RepID=UPI00193A2F0F|nr:insulin-like growth factor-binding protein complex acid labile subunit [Styela clava]
MNKLHLLIVLTICSLAAVGSEARHIQDDVARLCQPTPLSTIQKGIHCSCSAHHSLQSIPRQNDWQKNGLVLTIRLHGCRDIGSIGKELSTYHDLKTLDIQGSGIKKLENEAMIFNIDITTLIIKNSKISRIEPNAFIGISKLRYLDLSGNKIDNLPVEAFKEIRTLQTLNLDGNKIDFIGKEIFVRLSSLQSLSLRGNRVGTIDPDAFQNMLSLREILLDDNMVRNLDLTPFVGLPELITLSVSNNKITKWTVPREENGVYDTNVVGNENYTPAKLSVKILIMANNDMTVLSDKFFQAMPLIEVLDVSDNSLTYIGGNAISKLRQDIHLL